MYPDIFQKICEYADKKEILFWNAANELKLNDFKNLSGYLCTYWNLPGFVKAACENNSIESLKAAKKSGKKSDFIKLLSIASMITEVTIRQLNQNARNQIFSVVKKNLEINQTELDILLKEFKELQMEADSFAKLIF